MANKLIQILENKRQEVAQKKKTRDFLGSIKNPKIGDIAIITEIKLASPTAGKLGEEKEIEKRAILYGKNYADVISLVVDKKYFDGDLNFIKQIKGVISLPILAKDFIVDSYQIHEMKYYGADAILLIVKILSQNKLKQFIKLSFELGLEPVVEVQNEEELDRVIDTDTRCIAVNARDLSSFEVDIKRACRLISLIPQKFVALGFSGVLNHGEVEKYKAAGAKAILVGTSLMRAKCISGLIKELKGL